MGIARIMCIPLTKTINGKQEIKDFNELLENIADKYCMLKRRQRRELYFIVKKSVEIDEKKVIKMPKKVCAECHEEYVCGGTGSTEANMSRYLPINNFLFDGYLPICNFCIEKRFNKIYTNNDYKEKSLGLYKSILSISKYSI